MHPTTENPIFDSLECSNNNSEKSEPKIFINTRGEWVFDEDDDEVPEDWKEEVPIINRGVDNNNKNLIWSTIDEEVEEEEHQPEVVITPTDLLSPQNNHFQYS